MVFATTLICCDYCGIGYTLCLSNSGELHEFGKLEYRGQEKESKVFLPRKISLLKDIKTVSRGSFHCLALDINGIVFCFGNNDVGQLGIHGASIIVEPQQINLPIIEQISCGGDFSMCLSENGELFSFGFGYYGNLGIGSTKEYNTPQKINLKNIDFVRCGGDFTMCKTFDNEIYSWGLNATGQLGLGSSEYQQNLPKKLKDVWYDEIIDIACGTSFTLLLTANYEVFSCGRNDFGQLGRKINTNYSSSFQQIEELSEITRIECGYTHSMCVDINNDLYVFGYNKYGQLGLGDTDNRYTPIKHPSLSNIIDISNGGYHTFIKTSNNEIYAFGRNNRSQLGIKTEHENQITPIRVFEDNEDIWFSNINKSKAKSARSILPRPSNEHDNYPIKKK